MVVHPSAPESLSGHLLFGTNAVRFIFMDEAGTSPSRQEKAVIVAGVIMHADNHVLAAEALINEAMTSVPEQFRKNWAFHAEDVMNNAKYRNEWRLTDRVDFLKEMMSIPRRLSLAVAFGQMWTHAKTHNPKLRPHVERHVMAFVHCAAKADQYMRERAGPLEIATIVAERNDNQKELSQALLTLRSTPLTLGPGMLNDRLEDVRQGYNSQKGVFKVTRIRKSIHFVGKHDDPLVWIADAVAYGLKRYFSELQFGDEFAAAIGEMPVIENFSGPASGGLFGWA